MSKENFADSLHTTDPMTSVSTLILATQVKFTNISPKPDIPPLNPKPSNFRELCLWNDHGTQSQTLSISKLSHHKNHFSLFLNLW